MNIPNALTIFRILLIPVFVLMFYLPFSWSYTASALVFFLAGFTDWLDGYLARRLDQSTPFGAFLDPVADKLMVAMILVILVGSRDLAHLALPAAVIVGREIVVSALREWMAEIGARTKVAVSILGKFKTALQLIAILLLLYKIPVGLFPTHTVGVILLYIAAILTLWSMFVYLKAAWPILSGKEGQSPPDGA